MHRKHVLNLFPHIICISCQHSFMAIEPSKKDTVKCIIFLMSILWPQRRGVCAQPAGARPGQGLRQADVCHRLVQYNPQSGKTRWGWWCWINMDYWNCNFPMNASCPSHGWLVRFGWLAGRSVRHSLRKDREVIFFYYQHFFIKHRLITCITGVINVIREAILKLLLSEH